MKSPTRTGTLALIATLMTTTASFADVNAQQVWGDMKAYLEGFGYNVSATEATSGDTLKVTDITMSMTFPEDDGNAKIGFSEMSFTDKGDGTVSVGMPNVMPITMQFAPKDEKAADITADYTQNGFSMIVSGDPENMTYNYTADDLGIALKSLVVDGKPVDVAKFDLTMKNIIGNSIMKVGNLRTISQTIQADTLAYNIDVTNPEANGTFKMEGALNTLKFDGSGSYPSEMNFEEMAAMLKAGFAFDGTFSYSGGNSTISVDDQGKKTDIKSRSESGDFKVAMDASKLVYNLSSKGVALDLSGGDIPFPVALQMAESGFNLTMPVAKADEEQDFAFGIKMANFTMSDMIWGIFDPSAQLPRDPATIAIDTTGKVKLFFDLLDPKQMEAVEKGAAEPGELNALTLNSLTVSAAGAELTGNGGFTFDNTDKTTFDGMPAPTGAIDLKLVGGNALLDKLVAMGLLPEDQAMGTRMMMGMFAVAGEGEDTLNSKIEVNSEGHVMANGQRLK